MDYLFRYWNYSLDKLKDESIIGNMFYKNFNPPLIGKYGGKLYHLHRYYPDIQSYAYFGPNQPGYGFIKENAIKIVEEPSDNIIKEIMDE